MGYFRFAPLASLLVALISLNASAQEKAPSLPDAGGAGPEEDEGDDLQSQIDELREKLRQAEDARASNVSPLSINGYVDFGFFWPMGNNGVGWVRDPGNMR